MEYTKQTWTAPTGTGLSRYAKSGETETHVELALDPVNLTNTPTPFTMARMAHMEEGIAKAYDTAPPTPWAQYSGKDIPQLPDNLAGTAYKRDNDWTTVDGWASGWVGHTAIALSVEDETLKVIYDGTRLDTGVSIQKNIATTGKFIKGHIKCTVPIINVRYYTGTVIASLTLATPNAYETDFYGYIPTAYTDFVLYINQNQLTAKTCWLSQLYIGSGAYDRLVFDNSYHYRHLLNNAVIPTPQGLYFNGATSYLRSKEMVTLPDVFTFSATVNCAINPTQIMSLFTFVVSVTDRFKIYRNTNTNTLVLFYYNTNIANVTYINLGSFFIDNVDIDIKVEIDFINKVVKIYKNYVLINTTPTPYFNKPAPAYYFIGSAELVEQNLLGYMRNICIFDTSLTDTQRNWLAKGNTPPILYDVTNYETEGYVRIQDADGTNTGVETDVDSNGNRILKLPATIKATLSGNAATADKWKTARNISISDADGTNTGTAVVVDGSENETLKLPATIKATLSGNASTASKANVRVSLRHGNTWFDKTWTGLTEFNGEHIWTDGDNIYYSYSTTQQYVLNKTTSTWVTKTWTGLPSFDGNFIWTDGENIYHSTGTAQFELNKTTYTWIGKIWTGLPSFYGDFIWTDGENIYYSYGTEQFVLNKTTPTWTTKTWTGLTNFLGTRIWTDGENIYFSSGTDQFVLNKATSTWTAKTWTGLTDFNGSEVWTDGENIYHSNGTSQLVLNKTTSTWTAKTWTGLTDFIGYNNWTDGENIYYSSGTTQYVLPATRHNYVDDDKYNSLFGTVTKCICNTLSDRFVFRNE